uniref:Uncharacterized protein n=1 Tax=Rhizophora mucronata TaxID=61149 RepID=A0A2P2NRB4_RHIMU
MILQPLLGYFFFITSEIFNFVILINYGFS